MGPRTKAGANGPPKERTVLELAGLGIELRPFAALGFKPANVIVGISSEGIVGPLVATSLVQHLKMVQVCALESQMFPPTAMVYYAKPKFPARIYASKRQRLAVVLAEFAPDDGLARPLAHAILAWCESNGAKRVLGIDSFPAQSPTPQSARVAAIGATPRDRRAIAQAKVPEVLHGAVTGVAGVLLNEGRWRDLDTLVLMASLGEASDTEVAMRVIEVVQKLLPGLPLRDGSKAREPDQLEKAIRAAHQRESHDYI